MVGEDGWCIHFDTGGRRCRIYDTRPDFCRVENLVALFAAPGASEPPPASRAPAAAVPPTRGRPSSNAEEEEHSLDAAGEALAIAACRTQIRAEYGGRGRVMRRFEQAIRRTP